MSYRISYAQNFEDILLWRALGHVANGRYIDIGAQSATVDSVSRLFHDAGWTGIHVEPVEAYATELRAARPGDIVVQAAVSDTPGLLSFYRIAHTGLSTLSDDVAASHAARGFVAEEVVVPAITLDNVFARAGEGDIHWLKIDVEGAEADVLRSWSRAAARPWVLVIEATAPLDETPVHEAWESIVVAKGYKPVWFDGLNRFYVSNEHPELLAAFVVPPNIFDRFAIGIDASTLFAAEFRARLADAEQRHSDTEATLVAQLAEATRGREDALAQQQEFEVRLAAAQDAVEVRLAEAQQAFEMKMAAAQHVLEKRVAAAQQASDARLAEVQEAHAVELVARHQDLIKVTQSFIDMQSHHSWERDVWRQERAALEQQLADRVEAGRSWEATARLRKQQLEAVYASTSWRITAPVRGVKLFVHALLRRIRGEMAFPAASITRVESPVVKVASLPSDDASFDVRGTLSRRGRLAAALLDTNRKDSH